MSLIEWKFQERRAQCSACAAAFADGERHASMLAIAAEQITRDDLCLGCWEKRTPGEEIFFWFTRHRTDRRRLHLDLATLEQLFLQLEGRAETRVRELRYILCLLLMRKRRLKLVRVVRDADGESLIVKRPRRTETCAVFVFDFAPERLDELRRELVRIFEGSEAMPAGPVDGTAGGEPVDADTALASELSDGAAAS